MMVTKPMLWRPIIDDKGPQRTTLACYQAGIDAEIGAFQLEFVCLVAIKCSYRL